MDEACANTVGLVGVGGEIGSAAQRRYFLAVGETHGSRRRYGEFGSPEGATLAPEVSLVVLDPILVQEFDEFNSVRDSAMAVFLVTNVAADARCL